MEREQDMIEFLVEARDGAEYLDALKKERSSLIVEEKRAEKILSTERAAMQADIDEMIRQRKQAITESYDREIAEGKEKLRRVRAKKEKAKELGREERIQVETADLLEDNRDLQTRIGTLFKQQAVPGWCNSLWFYSLYMPTRPVEWLLAVLVFLVCFAAIPCGVFFLLPETLKSPWIMAAIYLAAITVFGVIYLIINSTAKIRHLEALSEGLAIRAQMRSNRHKITAITKAIRSDRTEDAYDLDKYNQAILQREEELRRIADKKQNALTHFEAVTRSVISEEVTDSRRDRLEELTADYEAVSARRRELENEMREGKIAMTDRYEGYLGKDFLNADKIDELIEILESGQASTITEAITVYKNSSL